MVNQLDTLHPNHPHHLECPKCGRHTVVLQGDSYYACIACGWRRDIAEEREFLPLPIIIVLAIIIVLLF